MRVRVQILHGDVGRVQEVLAHERLHVGRQVVGKRLVALARQPMQVLDVLRADEATAGGDAQVPVAGRDGLGSWAGFSALESA